MAAVGSHTVGVGSLMTGVGSLAAAVGSLGFVSGGSACGLGRGRLAGESCKSLIGRRFGNAEAWIGTRQRWVRSVEKRNVDTSERRNVKTSKRRSVRTSKAEGCAGGHRAQAVAPNRGRGCGGPGFEGWFTLERAGRARVRAYYAHARPQEFNTISAPLGRLNPEHGW